MSLVRTALATAVVALVLSRAVLAEACPRCEAGRQARSEVWDDHFGMNLSVAILPFVIVGAVCVGAERIGRRRDVP